jgi:hypothetical protein
MKINKMGEVTNSCTVKISGPPSSYTFPILLPSSFKAAIIAAATSTTYTGWILQTRPY